MHYVQRFSILLLLATVGCGGYPNSQAPGHLIDNSQSMTASRGQAVKAVAERQHNAPADKIVREQAQPQEAPVRKIIYTAKVEIIVEDFESARTELLRLVKSHKEAYISQSDVTGNPGTPRSGTWTIRLPVPGLDAFLEAVASLGELQRNNLDSQDVTDEYYDLQARIKNKQVEEKRLLKHLEESTGKLQEILAVEKEITRVRGEIERMQGRMQYLEKLSALTTVTVTMHERKGYVPPQTPAFGTTVGRTFDSSLEALLDLGKALILIVVALAPWLPVLAVTFVPLGLWVRRQIRSKRVLAEVVTAQPIPPVSQA